ncbi:MAG TPA: FMN-binding protein [Longimicrobiales bacterium]|nr:FMN-binding protein [Longimicrobiales bacterium]
MKYFAVAVAVLLSVPALLPAQAVTQEQALKMAFPTPLRVERRTAYLDDAQLARARDLAGSKDLTQRVVTYYVGGNNGTVVGTAYFDSHRVRTHGEVLMIVVDREWQIERIEVLRFAEPPEYRASEKWLDQFEGKRLSPSLSVKRDIVPMTGATLTANAVTSAARRVLALHTIITTSSKR